MSSGPLTIAKWRVFGENAFVYEVDGHEKLVNVNVYYGMRESKLL